MSFFEAFNTMHISVINPISKVNLEYSVNVDLN